MSKKRKERPQPQTQPTAPASFSLIWKLVAAFFLIAATVVVYRPSLKVPFLLDDYGKIIRNPDIKNISNLPSRLVYPYRSPTDWERNDPSRPMTYLTLTADYHFNQLDPRGYHVTNLAIHCIVVILLFILGIQVFGALGFASMMLPFGAALVFAVHPVNLNVVTYVIGRAASLASVFYLSSIALFIRSKKGSKTAAALSALCYVLALSSNQLALTLPAALLALDYFVLSNCDRRQVAWRTNGLFWFVFAVYLGIRVAYFGRLGDVEAQAVSLGASAYLKTQVVVILKYVQMLIGGQGLSFEHGFRAITSLSDPRLLIAEGLYLATAILICFPLRRQPSLRRLVLFGSLWFLITISPTSSIFPTTATMAENRVYLPSIGIYFILTVSFYVAFRSILGERFGQIMTAIFLAVASTALGTLTFHRNELYCDPVELWADVIRRYPSHERAHNNLAIEYWKRGNFEGLETESKEALLLDPTDFNSRNNLAMSYYERGRFKDAVVAYREIIKLKPDYAAAYANLGLAYEGLKDPASAMAAYKDALRLDPNLIEPLNNLAGLYLEEGRVAEAVRGYEAALRIDPHNQSIRENYERARSLLRK